MELHGIAWTRIALSLSQVVETSWPSPPGIFPRGQPPWVFPRGSLWWGNRRGLNLSPRLARPPCDAPLLVGTALEREPPQPTAGARQDSPNTFPTCSFPRPPPTPQKNVPHT